MLAAGDALNAMDACAHFGIDAVEMDKQWGICKKAKKLVKFGGGFYWSSLFAFPGCHRMLTYSTDLDADSPLA